MKEKFKKHELEKATKNVQSEIINRYLAEFKILIDFAVDHELIKIKNLKYVCQIVSN